MVGDMAATAAASLAQSTSLWSSVSEWFTPTVFFVLLNVVIGTIAVTSKSLSHHHHHHAQSSGAKTGAEHHPQQQQYQYVSGAGAHDQDQYHDAAHPHPPPARQISRTGSMLQRLKSFNLNLNLHMYRGYRPEDYGVVAAPAAAPAVVVPETAAVVMEPVRKEPEQAKAQKPGKAKARHPSRRDPSPPRQQPPPQDEQRERSPNVTAPDAAEFETLEEAFLAASGGAHLNRIQSDTHPTAGEIPRKLAATMKKSASTKSAFSHFEPRDLPRRPATTRDDRRRSNLLQLDPAAEDEDSSNDEYDDAEVIAAVTAAGDLPRPNTEVDARADDFINRFRQQLKLQRLESLVRYRDMLNRGR